MKIIGQSTLRGIIPKKECWLPADVGELNCFLLDENGEVQEAAITAYLPKIDRVPIILGFETLLRKSRIVIDCENRDAFLEME